MNNPYQVPTAKRFSSIVTVVLEWAIPDDIQDAAIGDLLEAYARKCSSQPLYARVWLFRQVLSLVSRFAFQTQRGSLMFILFSIVLTSIVVMALWLGGDLPMYFNFPSIIIVLPTALMFARLSVSKQVFGEAFRCLIDTRYKSSIEITSQHSRVFTSMGNGAMLMGWFGVVTGAVAMASNIEPEVFQDVIGPATAVCLLTLLYAIVIKALCYMAELTINADNA